MIESPMLQRMRAETLHNAILGVLKDRFDTISRDLTKQLRSELDEKKLNKLVIVAGKCRDLDAFARAMR